MKAKERRQAGIYWYFDFEDEILFSMWVLHCISNSFLIKFLIHSIFTSNLDSTNESCQDEKLQYFVIISINLDRDYRAYLVNYSIIYGVLSIKGKWGTLLKHLKEHVIHSIYCKIIKYSLRYLSHDIIWKCLKLHLSVKTMEIILLPVVKLYL